MEQIGHTDVVTERDELGDIDDGWREWHDGVLSAESPAESAT